MTTKKYPYYIQWGKKGPVEANELIFTNFEMQRNRVVELDLFVHGV